MFLWIGVGNPEVYFEVYEVNLEFNSELVAVVLFKQQFIRLTCWIDFD